MFLTLLNLLVLLLVTKSFIFRNSFRKTNIRHKLNNTPIDYDEKHKDIIKQFSGFYGLIGPNVDFYKARSLIELFTGNGFIQGVFFNNGTITHLNHTINTEKKQYEDKWGKIPNHLFTSILLTTLQKVNMVPISTGTANTALINFANKTLALYETDYPYSIDINFENSTISTLKKERINNVTSFSGHTKIINNTIETIEYDLIKKCIYYIRLDLNYNIIEKTPIYTKYIPVVHDFITTKDYFIFFDSPLEIDTKKIFCNSFPVSLTNESAYIHVLNKHTKQITRYDCRNSFYIFHFANFKETSSQLIIEGSVVDELDFSNLDFDPHYRQIIINKADKKVSIVKYTELENIKLDFPIKLKNNNILFTIIEERGFSGFAICENMKIIKKILLKDYILCGEPNIIHVNNTEYLIGFTRNKTNKGFIYFLNLQTFDDFYIPSPYTPYNGFHSIFIPNDLKL